MGELSGVSVTPALDMDRLSKINQFRHRTINSQIQGYDSDSESNSDFYDRLFRISIVGTFVTMSMPFNITTFFCDSDNKFAFNSDKGNCHDTSGKITMSVDFNQEKKIANQVILKS